MQKIELAERLSQEDHLHAENLELDVRTILRLIDLIFLCKDDLNEIPS